MKDDDDFVLLSVLGGAGLFGALAVLVGVVWASTPDLFEWWIAAGITGVAAMPMAMIAILITRALSRP